MRFDENFNRFQIFQVSTSDFPLQQMGFLASCRNHEVSRLSALNFEMDHCILIFIIHACRNVTAVVLSPCPCTSAATWIVSF